MVGVGPCGLHLQVESLRRRSTGRVCRPAPLAARTRWPGMRSKHTPAANGHHASLIIALYKVRAYGAPQTCSHHGPCTHSQCSLPGCDVTKNSAHVAKLVPVKKTLAATTPARRAPGAVPRPRPGRRRTAAWSHGRMVTRPHGSMLRLRSKSSCILANLWPSFMLPQPMLWHCFHPQPMQM